MVSRSAAVCGGGRTMRAPFGCAANASMPRMMSRLAPLTAFGASGARALPLTRARTRDVVCFRVQKSTGDAVPSSGGVILKVAILEPAPVHHGWFHLEIRTPHLGPPVLAARLRSAGHKATVYSEFVAPIPLGEL